MTWWSRKEGAAAAHGDDPPGSGGNSGAGGGAAAAASGTTTAGGASAGGSSSAGKRKSGGGGGIRRNLLLGKGRSSGGAAAAAAPDGSDSEHKQDDSAAVHVLADSVSGIEVAFSDNDLLMTTSSTTSPSAIRNGTAITTALAVEGMISFREQMNRRRKVYRGQFSVAANNANYYSGDPTASGEGELEGDDDPSVGFRVGRHRVPIFGAKKSRPLFDDALFLLRSHEVRDELSCVREELTRMNAEISALETDRGRLERKALHVADDDGADGGMRQDGADAGASSNQWDTHRLLSSPTERLSKQQRSALQERRGLALSISLHNQQAREVFLARCGSIASVIRAEQQRARNAKKSAADNNSDAVICLRPENCRDGGAAATMQHVALIKGATSGSEASAFFISKDKGKSYCWGHLPDRLFRRMKSSGYDPKHHVTDIVYLSTGPMGCYYAQFRSGECWWGSIADDREFDAICGDRDWDIHRVVFGGGCAVTDAHGHKHATTSWIILGRDGRACWKNLPARLHNKLESRMASEAAPAEVALGSGGSYFIRFLDGSTDYCLPARTAQVCRDLEKDGKAITSVSLSPELSRDFIIRHH